MVPAQQMPMLLQVLLAEGELQLVSLLNTKPLPFVAVAVAAREESSTLAGASQLFKHGLTIKLRGRYMAVLEYLKELEAQEWKFIWRSMTYEVLDYPIGELELNIQTLSKDERWLGV